MSAVLSPFVKPNGDPELFDTHAPNESARSVRRHSPPERHCQPFYPHSSSRMGTPCYLILTPPMNRFARAAILIAEGNGHAVPCGVLPYYFHTAQTFHIRRSARSAPPSRPSNQYNKYNLINLRHIVFIFEVSQHQNRAFSCALHFESHRLVKGESRRVFAYDGQLKAPYPLVFAPLVGKVH